MTAWIVLGVFIVLTVAIALWAIGVYNRLVQLRNRFKNAFAQIDVQLKRRYDLIPNLVETAKGYLTHEKETLENVIQARNIASSAREAAAAQPDNVAKMQELKASEGRLAGALTGFFALSEAYPELKANQNMMQLTEELTSTENKISFARQAFNDAVMVYNTQREQFPAVVLAGPLGFTAAEFFEIEDKAEKAAPKVSF